MVRPGSGGVGAADVRLDAAEALLLVGEERLDQVADGNQADEQAFVHHVLGLCAPKLSSSNAIMIEIGSAKARSTDPPGIDVGTKPRSSA